MKRSFQVGRMSPMFIVGLAVTMFACSETTGTEQVTGSAAGKVALALADPIPGLVAAFGFDEASGVSVLDASGNGNGGTLGSGVSRDAAGRFGAALSFNGGMVTVPDAPSLALTAGMTVEAWVRPDVVDNAWRDVVQKATDRYYLMVTSENGSRAVGAVSIAGTTGTTKAFALAPIAPSTWTHLATTYDGVAIRMFVNGTLVSSTSRTGVISTSSSPLTIGGDAAFGQFFSGKIDEVRIYNRALSAAEITADMTTPVERPLADTQSPSLAITTPATATFATTATSISIAGTSSDNVGVSDVSWVNDRGGSGVATGTTTWVANGIPLSDGVNLITVTARDTANNTATAAVAVTVTQPTPVGGLVAALGFDEASGTVLSDLSGKANAGSLGSGVTRVATGRFGGALSFNGAGMVTIANSASLSLTTAGTFEAWVNPSVVDNAWRDVIYKGRDRFYLMGSTENGFKPAAAVTIAGATGTTKAYGSKLTANVWTHLAATYDGASIKLYVNGVLASSTARSGTISTSTNPLTIGGDPIFGQFFRGLIDEVRLYDRALTGPEIQVDMAAPIGSAPPPPPPPPDTQSPSVSITIPTSASTFATTSNLLTVGGTAQDNVGVTQITWANDRGGSGTATGTSTWTTGGIALVAGTNLVTVTARDAAGNSAGATLSVTFTLPPIATRLAMVTQPSSSSPSGAVFAQQPAVQLRDAAGNPVPQAGVVVTAAIASGGGTLGGTPVATTNASGIATFTNLSITGTAGNRTLVFTSPALASVTSGTIAITVVTVPPPTGEPVFNAAVNAIVYQDNMDAYTSVQVMGTTQSTTPRIVPHPSPITNSEPVKSGSQLITGRGGSGKALRLAYSGANQEEQQFITMNIPGTSDQTTHYFSYYARINSSSPFTAAVPVKWFEAWHNSGNDRIQWNTHDPLPCPIGSFSKTYWQVIDTRQTTCQGNQPVGPYFNNLANDGLWHRFTYQFRPNSTAGARDGIARMWIDGVKIIDISATAVGVTPPGGDKPWCLVDDIDALAVNNGIRTVWWGSTQTLPSAAWSFDVDDFVWWR